MSEYAQQASNHLPAVVTTVSGLAGGYALHRWWLLALPQLQRLHNE